MNHSTPGLPVHHQLPEFTQAHVHRVSDAIQPSHPGSSPSPPAPNPSQHQSLFQWVFTWGGQSTEVSALASFFPKKSQGWSPSEWTGWNSLQSIGGWIYLWAFYFVPLIYFPLFFLKIALAIRGFLYSHTNCEIIYSCFSIFSYK